MNEKYNQQFSHFLFIKKSNLQPAANSQILYFWALKLSFLL